MKLAYTDDDWERAEYDYRCKKEERRVMDNSVEIYEAFAGDQLEEDERRIKGCIVSDIEREEFEQAVADKWSDSYKFTRFGDEDYYDEVLEGMWRGWQASRQALEGEAVAEITEGHVLQWRPPYNRPPVGTKLYAQPPTKADEQAHKRVHEYDGAHKCLDCGAQWGALPGHPKEPEHCAALAQPVSVPDGRSNEWLKTLDRWIDLMDRLEGEPINTSVQREIYRVKTEVMRYRKHKVAPKQEQDDE